MGGDVKDGRIHSSLFADNTSICTNHQGRAIREGGKWLTSNGGKNLRWICAVCYANRQARKAELEKGAA